MALILAIESSCDETSAAVVRSGEELLSNVVYSQIATHAQYGGVVPELASREHLRAIVPVVREALAQAGQAFQTIDAIAVTQGPGLAGALLVGITYAKALAFALNKPLIAVNHLEGHIHAVLLEGRQSGSELRFPALALVVSGGHTHLYLVNSPQASSAAWRYTPVGHTLDDAAGEAFDKVAKLLGLGYPGGPIIEYLAQHGNSSSVKFAPAQIKLREKGIAPDPNARKNPRTRGGTLQQQQMPRFDFSFSGIKTAVLRYVQTHEMQSAIDARRRALAQIPKPAMEDYLTHCDPQTLDLIASFQRAVVDDLAGKTLAAAEEYGAQGLLVTGGVAANSRLRERSTERAERLGLSVHFPSRKLSTDNAAMIAAAAFPKFVAGEFSDPQFSAEASLALGG
ncbi:MAG TPA: tRNA (adenosine(37)-N6)-threonylcarbamoyltransferase complex transferase subunit TsaD [Terriglobales bacterium]